MARIDKSIVSHRAKCGTVLSGLVAVKRDAGGSVIPAGSADAWGVVCLPGTLAAGRPVSVFKHAEIVEFGGSAGTDYYATGGGSIGTATGGTLIGGTFEADRLIVHMV